MESLETFLHEYGWRLLAMLAVICALVFLRWVYSIFTCRPKPDPWDEATAQAVKEPDAVLVCHHCFSPQPYAAHFCEQCGTSVGEYNNMLPYEYLFSIGECLRTGTSGNYRRTGWNKFGFVLTSACQYSIFAPVYWFLMVRNSKRLAQQPIQEDAPPSQI